jgi:predicted nucleotidyltransferase
VGLASAMEDSLKLFTGTLREMMEIIIPGNLRGKMAVGFFGSAARGELVPQSDIDFAFIIDKKLSKKEIEQVKDLYTQTIDLLVVFGFPFEAASGMFYPDGRITHKPRDTDQNKGAQIRSLQDLTFLFGNKKVFDGFKEKRLQAIYANARENIELIFDELPLEISNLKYEQRFITFIKHIASIYLKKSLKSTHEALAALYKEKAITKRDYHRLRMILDRISLMRLTMTLPNETRLSEGKVKDYLANVSQGTNPVRVAENFMYLGLPKDSPKVGKDYLIQIVRRDVEYLEDFIERFRNHLLSEV